MEVYYKDLISEDATLDKLVDDLVLLVQGANEFADAAGVRLGSIQGEELRTRLERLKEGCVQVSEHVAASARATDKLLRHYPYSFAGLAFAIGLAAGLLSNRKCSAASEES
jgi:ElaB/YqjD/DUF883 family membrane-anchored ribosome-binding protein